MTTSSYSSLISIKRSRPTSPSSPLTAKNWQRRREHAKKINLIPRTSLSVSPWSLQKTLTSPPSILVPPKSSAKHPYQIFFTPTQRAEKQRRKLKSPHLKSKDYPRQKFCRVTPRVFYLKDSNAIFSKFASTMNLKKTRSSTKPWLLKFSSSWASCAMEASSICLNLSTFGKTGSAIPQNQFQRKLKIFKKMESATRRLFRLLCAQFKDLATFG